MNKQALQEELSRAESEIQVARDRIAAIKSELDKPVGLWTPKPHQEYWVIKHGRISTFTNAHQQSTDGDISVGNCFETRKQAQAALDRQKLKTEIINTIAELNDGWVPDWSDSTQEKFIPFIDDDKSHHGFLIDILRYTSVRRQADRLYLKSRVAADQLKTKYTPEQLTAAYWG